MVTITKPLKKRHSVIFINDLYVNLRLSNVFSDNVYIVSTIDGEEY